MRCPLVGQNEWRATRSDKLPVTSLAEQRGLNIQQLISEQETAPGYLKGNPAITAPTLCTPRRTSSSPDDQQFLDRGRVVSIYSNLFMVLLPAVTVNTVIVGGNARWTTTSADTDGCS